MGQRHRHSVIPGKMGAGDRRERVERERVGRDWEWERSPLGDGHGRFGVRECCGANVEGKRKKEEGTRKQSEGKRKKERKKKVAQRRMKRRGRVTKSKKEGRM